MNTYKDTLKEAKDLKENVWFGVRHDMIYLLGPEEKKKELHKFRIEDLVVKIFPKLIHLII